MTAWTAVVRDCHANGYTVSQMASESAGMQVDAAVISPAREPIGRETGAIIYVVRSGDSIGALAEQFGVSSVEIAHDNGLADPDLLLVGSVINIPGGSRERRADAGEYTAMRAWPWPPIQGQTVVVWLQGPEPLGDGTAQLGDIEYPIIGVENAGWAMLPIDPLTTAGSYPVQLSSANAEARLDLPIQEGVFDYYDIPAETAAPILSEAELVAEETSRLEEIFAGWQQSGWTPEDRFATPLEGEFARTSPFGSRRTYAGGSTISAHSGEDFSAPSGTPVTVPADGLVVLAETLFVRGNAVIVDHGHGVFTGYWHLLSMSVAVGDRVETGQLLGEVGSTGLSTGAHLHWETRIHGVAVDPLQWLAALQ